MSAEATAQWLQEAKRYGLSCMVVEGKKDIGPKGTFEDACVKTRLRITKKFLAADSGNFSVQWQELKGTEVHSKRPSSPVFRTAREEVTGRLATVRWNQTGRQLKTAQYVHLIFPTRADVIAFRTGISEVQRYGFSSAVTGDCHEGNEDGFPTEWHILRAREFFAKTLKAYRGRSWAGQPVADSQPLAPPDATLAELGPEGHEAALALDITESAEMHERWCEALEGRSPTALSPEELRSLAPGGIPLKHRHVLWPHWVRVADLENLDELQGRAPEGSSRQVELDLPRTQPEWLSDENRQMLRRVLRGYAARNPRLGYCQGMNFLAMIFILLGFQERLVFSALCHLIEVVCEGYHSMGLEGYLRDAAVLGALVQRKLPAVHQCLERTGVELHILALEHFMTLASRAWPIGVTVRLWDIILLEGSPAVFASFMAALELYLLAAEEKACSQANDVTPADVMQQFKMDARQGIEENLDSFLSLTQRWVSQVPKPQLDWLRREISNED